MDTNSDLHTSDFDDVDSYDGIGFKQDESTQHVARMALKETRNVRMWRRNVFLMLFISASIVTTLTFLLLRDEDEEDFETSFNQFAATIRDSTEYNLLGVLEATDGLSDVVTSEAVKSNSDWPYVTMSAFEVFVRHTRAQASSEFIVVAPIVTADNLEKWLDYSTANQGWIEESFAVSGETNTSNLQPIPTSVYRFGNQSEMIPEEGTGDYPMAPFWQMSPPPVNTSIVNFNSLSIDDFQEMYDNVIQNRHWSLGRASPNAFVDYTYSDGHDKSHTEYPHTTLIYPVYRVLDNPDSDVVALAINVLPWDQYLSGALPDGVNGVYCVLQNTWDQVFTYNIRGNDVVYMGEGDLHDTTYDDMQVIIEFSHFFEGNDDLSASLESGGAGMQYWLAVYPSEELESAYKSNNPMIFALISISAFVLMTLTFVLYDWFVIRKNNKILDAAAHSDAILSSLFPKEVKDRLLQEKKQRDSAAKPLDNLKQFLNDDDGSMKAEDVYRSKPIADLFPETTVFFADLVGFTAWSSTREPTSVFVLLETLFGAFDKIARRTSIYKVETIGDCYVAISGLPEPRQDHAIAMVRFAVQCMHKMKELTKTLEEALGPETSTLSMRIGLHSGPVTAGVLRGERSRFQLFGDTVNTAARMESNGQPGRIHMSQDTATLLEKAGKGYWLEKRTDVVQAKGKGEMQTYWLANTQGDRNVGDLANDSLSSFDTERPIRKFVGNEELLRLIQWNVQRFTMLLREIETKRNDDCTSTTVGTSSAHLEEAKEGIPISRKEQSGTACASHDDVKLHSNVVRQLEEYITLVAGMYEPHAFHNFNHATHVIMSILKLMSQFQAPTNDDSSSSKGHVLRCVADPLTKFACAFSALIHDVNHPGVPNSRLIQEDPEVGKHYKGRSVAEQRSFDIAWELLQEDRFVSLRSAIFSSNTEEKKFRQLVLDSVITTDIADPHLRMLRSDRWERAFGGSKDTGPKCSMDEKTSVIIEQLIQASDIAHTMQQWSVYCKWNECLFDERYRAFKENRSDTDPTDTWYAAELSFFDNYVIPLAKRLKRSTSYLGVSGKEYLDCALKNRTEWEKKGRELVREMSRKQKSLGLATSP